MAKKLIIGLGNPGPRYKYTRHNAGFWAVDELAKAHRLSFKLQATTNTEIATGEDFTLAKPQTFMNNSGVAVAKLVKKFGLTPADLLIILDDVDLRVGNFRYREEGSSGGQKGLKSILETLGTQTVPRIRIGVGKDDTADTSDYVLSKFTLEEKTAVSGVIQQIVSNISQYL